MILLRTEDDFPAAESSTDSLRMLMMLMLLTVGWWPRQPNLVLSVGLVSITMIHSKYPSASI
jgi:hypothetical protein